MDSILLQKQITENAEELQSLAQDLISWEKEMKRKERSRAHEISENQQEVIDYVYHTVFVITCTNRNETYSCHR